MIIKEINLSTKTLTLVNGSKQARIKYHNTPKNIKALEGQKIEQGVQAFYLEDETMLAWIVGKDEIEFLVSEIEVNADSKVQTVKPKASKKPLPKSVINALFNR